MRSCDVPRKNVPGTALSWSFVDTTAEGSGIPRRCKQLLQEASAIIEEWSCGWPEHALRCGSKFWLSSRPRLSLRVNVLKVYAVHTSHINTLISTMLQCPLFENLVVSLARDGPALPSLR